MHNCVLITVQTSSSAEGTGRVVAVLSLLHSAPPNGGQPAAAIIAAQPLELLGGYSY